MNNFIRPTIQQKQRRNHAGDKQARVSGCSFYAELRAFGFVPAESPYFKNDGADPAASGNLVMQSTEAAEGSHHPEEAPGQFSYPQRQPEKYLEVKMQSHICSWLRCAVLRPRIWLPMAVSLLLDGGSGSPQGQGRASGGVSSKANREEQDPVNWGLNYVQAGEQSLIPRGIREALLHARLQRVCCSSEPAMPTVPLPQRQSQNACECIADVLLHAMGVTGVGWVVSVLTGTSIASLPFSDCNWLCGKKVACHPFHQPVQDLVRAVSPIPSIAFEHKAARLMAGRQCFLLHVREGVKEGTTEMDPVALSWGLLLCAAQVQGAAGIAAAARGYLLVQRGIPSSRGSFQSAVLAKIRNAKDLFGKSFSLLVPEYLTALKIFSWKRIELSLLYINRVSSMVMKQSQHASIAQGEKPPEHKVEQQNALEILPKGMESSGCCIDRIRVALRRPCTAAGLLCLFTATFLSETGMSTPLSGLCPATKMWRSVKRALRGCGAEGPPALQVPFAAV
ncbi:hypothetical protein Anapl_03600 [Anas platyrhynchos]|uniref:Uncharacterized protein n=1 Tax=Anas platyrhynchos TaxID=8839 RepID=R0KAV5_ANAPL|nr:hypothetical protein Anapl_03600 [Anas platyrhynchos]